MTTKLKAPFPAFGGKSRVAELVWSRLGAVRNYCEPFCFSAAMLLLRPSEPQIETINDLNAYVSNFWRAIQGDPEAVAHHADWPVNEVDLHARHAWLVRSDDASERLQQVRDDSEYFDAKIAGWWCWGACMWIGSGWCEERGANWAQIPDLGCRSLTEKMPLIGDRTAYGRGALAGQKMRELSQQLPHLQGDAGATGQKVTSNQAYKIWEGRGSAFAGDGEYGTGHGVNKGLPAGIHKKPILTSDGGTGDKGVNSIANLREQGLDLGKRPRLAAHTGGGQSGDQPGEAGTGVHGRPQLGDAYSRGRGVHSNDELTDCQKRRLWLIDWFTRLSDRLRPVRVCCGHWARVCDSDSTLTRLGTTGVFLDPPYRKHLACGKENRAAHIYANDKTQDVGALCDEVQSWCLKWGGDKEIRIAVCGLEGEYPELDAAGWERVAWKSQGGYGNRNKDNENAARERIWFSAGCLKGDEDRQRPLFT